MRTLGRRREGPKPFLVNHAGCLFHGIVLLGHEIINLLNYSTVITS